MAAALSECPTARQHRDGREAASFDPHSPRRAVEWREAERDVTGTDGPIRVFVHLAANKDAGEWRRAWQSGELVGVNDETPYGYGRAEQMGCALAFSESAGRGLLKAGLRLALRVVLGFDFLHAWNQRRAIARADIVWTHTESQALAVAAVLLLTGAKTKLLGQVVWLIDRWPHLGPLHRMVFRRLVARIDVMTFHSRANYERARVLFPETDLRIVPFGIPTETAHQPHTRGKGPLHVLALGNDRDRDWQTLAQAVSGEVDMDLLILSGEAPAGLARGQDNIRVRRARTNEELRREYEAADVVCVPLRPNLHASGATVVQEAVLAGVPVVATDVGGLDLYFSSHEIAYVPPGDPVALREMLRSIAEDPDAALARATAAQARLCDSGKLGAEAYIAHHVRISRELVCR